MNLKKMWKRFFSLSKGREGFTLVELIVVIAILAILGGVAVPAYSGYVEKAKLAGDEQLLADVNKAFASACSVNGADYYNAGGATAEIDSEGAVSVSYNVNGFDEAFGSFFDNEGRFEVFDALAYEASIGGFVEGMKLKFGEYEFSISKDLADALQNNTFSDIGADILMGKVGTVADIASLLIGMVDENGNLKMDATFNQLVFGNDMQYIKDLATSLGTDMDTLMGSFSSEEEAAKFLANSLVLTTAQKTQDMDTSFLGAKDSAAKLRSELDDPETATDAMAKLALTYGMYTSYVKNTPGMEDKSEAILADKSFTGMTDVLKEIESEDFRKYLASDQGKADLNAYKSAMQIVNNSASQSPDAAKNIMSNGFTDPDLVAVLNGLMNPAVGN